MQSIQLSAEVKKVRKVVNFLPRNFQSIRTMQKMIAGTSREAEIKVLR